MSGEKQAVKQLDHLIVRAGDPRPVFDFFSETLGLPVAWPFRSYPAFTSGGVSLGNLYLETISCGPPRATPSGHPPAARLAALAFEADLLEESLRQLDARRIPHGPVTNYTQREADGRKTRLYANSILGKMLGRSFWLDATILAGRLPGAGAMADAGTGGALVSWGMGKIMTGKLVFLVQYFYEHFAGLDLPHWSEFRSHAEKRAADRAALEARGGGPLGVRAVREVVAGVTDLEAARANWRKLLGDAARVATDVWEVADGPRVRLNRADADGLQTLVLEVSSQGRAETFLAERGMLGSATDDQLRIAPEKIFGLDVRLVGGARG